MLARNRFSAPGGPGLGPMGSLCGRGSTHPPLGKKHEQPRGCVCVCVQRSAGKPLCPPLCCPSKLSLSLSPPLPGLVVLELVVVGSLAGLTPNSLCVCVPVCVPQVSPRLRAPATPAFARSPACHRPLRRHRPDHYGLGLRAKSPKLRTRRARRGRHTYPLATFEILRFESMRSGRTAAAAADASASTAATRKLDTFCRSARHLPASPVSVYKYIYIYIYIYMFDATTPTVIVCQRVASSPSPARRWTLRALPPSLHAPGTPFRSLLDQR